MTNCFACGKPFQFDAGHRVGRKEECINCSADVHVCKNCQFYEPSAYNECKEPSAERVLDKDRSNFCDYFSLSSTANSKGSSSTENALEEADKLFK